MTLAPATLSAPTHKIVVVQKSSICAERDERGEGMFSLIPFAAPRKLGNLPLLLVRCVRQFPISMAGKCTRIVIAGVGRRSDAAGIRAAGEQCARLGHIGTGAGPAHTANIGGNRRGGNARNQGHPHNRQRNQSTTKNPSHFYPLFSNRLSVSASTPQLTLLGATPMPK